MVRSALRSLLSLGLLGLLVPVVYTQPACPELSMQVRAPKMAKLGGVVTINAKVRNAGGGITAKTITIKLTLPGAFWSPSVGHPFATGVKQEHKGMNSKVAATYEAPNVYWLPILLPPGKQVRVRVMARLAPCPAIEKTNLAFSGLVYQTDTATGNVTCATAASSASKAGTMTQIKAFPNSSKKTLAPSSCPTPVPPGTRFVPIAQNQRCLESQLTTMQVQERRREMVAGENGAMVAAGVVYMADDCYQACSLTLGYTAPFYMNFYQPATGPAECYCCQDCTLVYAPGMQAYRVDVAATQVRGEGNRTRGSYTLVGASL